MKGMEPPAFDPRASTGMGLGYIMSARGACHMRATFSKAEFMGLVDAKATAGKAPIYVDWEDWFVIMDSLIFCRFYRDLVPWPVITEVVNAATGERYTTEGLRAIAGRIVTETHLFNERRGFGAAQERLPARITERPLLTSTGESWSLTDKDLELMRREYYEARGWSYTAD